MIKTPVTLIMFNRPETTAKVFEQISLVKPPILLIISDGPRPDHPQDTEKVDKCRAILNKINWPCEVLRNYSEINLGCRERVSSGLSWVFDIVDEAVILEDDCLPHPSFFRFCEELLYKYKDDRRIMSISGFTFDLKNRNNEEESYFFSRYFFMWGWASWKRAWQHYDKDMEFWPKVRDEGWLEDILGSKRASIYWRYIFRSVYERRINTWDYPWLLSCWEQNGLSIIPKRNLISNIGFGAEATHTRQKNIYTNILPMQGIKFPLNHPKLIIRNNKADRQIEDSIYSKSILNRIKWATRKLRNYFRSN